MQITDSTVALVTGGASGLGGATAERLAADGAAVVVVDLPGEAGEQAAERLGERARFCGADVRNPEQVQAAIDVADAADQRQVQWKEGP